MLRRVSPSVVLHPNHFPSCRFIPRSWMSLNQSRSDWRRSPTAFTWLRVRTCSSSTSGCSYGLPASSLLSALFSDDLKTNSPVSGLVSHTCSALCSPELPATSVCFHESVHHTGISLLHFIFFFLVLQACTPPHPPTPELHRPASATSLTVCRLLSPPVPLWATV
jgi:hypothetical protein